MKRIPIFATLLVLLACGAMIALGLWQLRRADEKNALIATFTANLAQTSEVAFPAVPDPKHSLMFRRAGGFCLEPLLPRVEPGRNLEGQSGWRHLVSCRTGAEGPGMTVDIGWSQDFKARADWKGGAVRGIIAPAPDHRSLIGKLFKRDKEPGLLLILAEAVPGLEASASPAPRDIPNNHLAYAVQWFVFAAIAAIIYALALRRRMRASVAQASE